MGAKEVVDAVLRVIELLTAWPVILLVAIVLFRREVRGLLPAGVTDAPSTLIRLVTDALQKPGR